MAQVNPPYRADHVGSFLRPAALKEARLRFASGLITKAELTAAEDEAVRNLIAQQQANGLRVVTDGEFRRSLWHLDFLSELAGIRCVTPTVAPGADTSAVNDKIAFPKFQNHQPRVATLEIVDRIAFPKDHSFLAHFDFLKQAAGDCTAKQTIPSPTLVHNICCVRPANYQPIERYKNNEDQLIEDLAQCWTDAMLAFYERGCRYLQLDDTTWSDYCSEEKRAANIARGIDVDRIVRLYVKLINKILEKKPADMVVTMHICRGNFRSTWFSSGGYEPVAEELFGHCNLDGFFLEYDTDRAGGFEPLRHIKNQTVVLGLITSKFADLEEKEAVKARIAEAAKYVPLEQLALSPQCGFSSTEEGNILPEDAQWAKIRLTVEVAKEVWADA